MLLKKLAILSVLCTLLLSGKGIGNDYCGSCCQDSCWSGWSIYGDWLYWRVRNCGLDYALPGPVNQSSASLNAGKVFAVEPSYDSGFRIGIAKECDCFYFDAFYTHYKNEESDKIATNNGLSATRVVGLTDAVIPAATAKYEIDYNVVDIVGGYSSNPCYCFQTMFFGGFKYARIDQTYTALYFDPATPEDQPILVNQTNDMNAYGVDIGLGGEYAICNCLSAYGRLSYDILLGNFTRKMEQNASTAFAGDFVDLRDECWRALSVVNLAIGISSDYQFCCSCLDSLTLALGYEFHKWIDMPNFYAFGSADRVDRTPAGFGIDGVTIRLALKF
ncbi:MAG: hypothetical protein S4CHLAM123_03480 [Chlamydiales bacterium]|nr:hypothetical protein [Chlamydiales bacterium]